MINSVQQALAANLDMQAMYELVGDKIRDIFDAQAADIAIYDLDAGVVHYPYGIERGVRYPDEPTPLGGINRYLLDERKAIFVNQDFAGWLAARGIEAKVLQGDSALSVLFVPLIVGDEVRGRISLQNVDREDAFSDSDLRLLSTLASSLAVALENARLFDETKRLLTETDERAAELAVINSVQQALAANLDMQAMYELVGEKIRDIFDAQVVDIGIYRLRRRVDPLPVHDRTRRPISRRADPLGSCAMSTGGPARPVSRVMINDVLAWDGWRARRQDPGPAGRTVAVRALRLRSSVGDEVRGRISLQNLDRSDAFTDGDLRLLSTLASSLAVALENARLFDETKRLLAETDERAAELAVINSIQQGLAAKLDMQSMYDLVGEQDPARSSTRKVVGIDIYDIGDRPRRISHTPSSAASDLPDEPIPLIGFRKVALEIQGSPCSSTSDLERMAAEAAASRRSSRARWRCPCRLRAAHRRGRGPRPHLLQNVDHEDAFSDSDLRLLSTLASSLAVALENARLFDETKRLLAETDERAAELAVVNSVQRGLAENLDMQSMYELVGEKIREIFDAQVVTVAVYDQDAGTMRAPYAIERGVRFSDWEVDATVIRNRPTVDQHSRADRRERGLGGIRSTQMVSAAWPSSENRRSPWSSPPSWPAIKCAGRCRSRTSIASTRSANRTCACSPPWQRA